jgi:membrane fusion protein (multidrug efflux system)
MVVIPIFSRLSPWLKVSVLIVVIFASLAGTKFLQISKAIAQAESYPEPSETVKAVTVAQQLWSAEATAVGSVMAIKQVEIRNELAGVVKSIGFKSGETVKEGQLLLELDTETEQANLAAAKADLVLAKKTLARREKLKINRTISAEAIDTARADVARTLATVQSLQKTIIKKKIVAPFAGRVGLTNLQAGSYLQEGTLVTSLQGLERDAYVDFSLPQEAGEIVKIGHPVRLQGVGFAKQEFTGTVVAAESMITNDRTVKLRAVVKDLSSLTQMGQFVDVRVAITPPVLMIMVPVTAVRQASYGAHVYVLQEKEGKLRAFQRGVKTGAITGDAIVIKEGLSVGEKIAADGSFKLREGIIVNVAAVGDVK